MTTLAQQLMMLLPQGYAWLALKTEGSVMSGLVKGLAEPLQRLEAMAGSLLSELHPGTTDALLPEWLRELGLPDGCIQAESPEAWRRIAHARYTATGGASKAYFYELCIALGLQTYISENRPLRAGISTPNSPINDGDLPFTWQIYLGNGTVDYLRADISTPNRPIQSVFVGPVACLLDRLKPAHTALTIYGTSGLDWADDLDSFVNQLYPTTGLMA